MDAGLAEIVKSGRTTLNETVVVWIRSPWQSDLSEAITFTVYAADAVVEVVVTVMVEDAAWLAERLVL